MSVKWYDKSEWYGTCPLLSLGFLPVHAWCLTAPWSGPCSWPSSHHDTPAGPLWSAARSLTAPDRRHPQTAWGGMQQHVSATSKLMWSNVEKNKEVCHISVEIRQAHFSIMHIKNSSTWTPLSAVWPCCQDISWHCCHRGKPWRKREDQHWPGNGQRS